MGNDANTRRVLGYIEQGERRRLAAIRLADDQPGRLLRTSLPASVEAPARARRLVAGFLGGSVPDARRYVLQLVASELVKNAVMYGSSDEPVQLVLAVHGDWIDLRVTNRGARIEMTKLRSRREDAGRGLEIVDALAWGWTIDTGPVETAVSVRLPIIDLPFDRVQLARLARRRTGYDVAMPRGRPGGAATLPSLHIAAGRS